MSVTTIKLKDRELRLVSKGLPDDFDIDRILKIDYTNLEAELVTIPILMNNVGLLLADMDSEVRLAELKLKKEKAKLAEQGREAIKEDKNGKAATNDETLEYVRSQISYDVLNRKLSSAIYKRDVINSIYWSIKSKQEILQNLSKSMNFGDFQDALVRNSIREINYVKLDTKDVLIK